MVSPKAAPDPVSGIVDPITTVDGRLDAPEAGATTANIPAVKAAVLIRVAPFLIHDVLLNIDPPNRFWQHSQSAIAQVFIP
jgi:hypothetical protein